MTDDPHNDLGDYSEQDQDQLWRPPPRPPCRHDGAVVVAVRPYCADCGQPIPLGHPLAKAARDALKRLRGGS